MATAPVPIRPSWWLVSAGLHAIGFIAMGHPPAPSSGSAGQVPDAVVVDLTPESAAEPSEPLPVRAGLGSPSFVPPPTHTHPYPVAPDHDAHPHDPALVHVPFALPRPSVHAVVAAPAEPAHFSMRVMSDPARCPVARPAEVGPGAEATLEPRGNDAPVVEETVSSPAQLAGPMSPVYPAAARAQAVEADVLLAIVVTSTGEVTDARILQPAGFGFDEEALRAIRTARFTPARRGGRPVAVRMRWSVSFRLR